MLTMIRTLALSAMIVAPIGAQVPSWYPWHNQVSPRFVVSAELDAATGDFAYQYTVANDADAKQRISSIYLELPLSPSRGGLAPRDWEMLSIPPSTAITWFAGGAVDPSWVPAHELDIPSYLSEIAPGRALAGFVLFSPCGAGTTPVTYYVEGYNHLAKVPDDDTTSWVQIPQWRDDAVKGTVIGPGDCNTVADWGNRRPGVDGFLGLVNFASGSLLPRGPVTVQVRFSRAGEQVDRATFQAVLNGENVTASFRMNSRGDMAAVFPVVAPLRIGRNTLLLSVDGVVSGTRTATDADRFVFEVQ